MTPNSQQLCDGLTQALKEGAQLVDVRTPAECARGTLPGAINIPLDQLSSAQDRLDFGQTLLLYCRSGQRSEIARRFLTDMGHTDCWNIGGYDAFSRC